MNIEKIKEQIESKKGKTLKFKLNGSRNQVEEFEGKIVNTYPGIFLVQLDNQVHMIKSFSYSDLLTLHLEIKDN